MGRVVSSVRLTKRVVDQADLSRGRHYLWDCELRGFGVCIETTGTKTYLVRYRPKGLGRHGSRRFLKLGRHGDLTAEQARELAKVVLGQVASGRDPAVEQKEDRANEIRRQEAITFVTLGDLFIRDHVQLKRKPATVDLYHILLRVHAYPRLGKFVAEQVTRAQLAAFHASMKSKSASANRTIQVISSMYSFAAKSGLVPEGFNPARGIEKFREQSRERYLTTNELQRLGNALNEGETNGIPWEIDSNNHNSKHTPKFHNGRREVLDPYAVAAIRLLLFTGARLREILHLKWEHIDLDRGLLFLADSKSGKKTIVLNTAAIAVITCIAKRSVPCSIEVDRGRTGLFVKGGIANQPRADLKRPWNAIRRHANLEGVRIHDLRHTFASIGAGASLGLPVVGRLLGHSQPQTTARYAHLDANPLRRASNIIGGQLVAGLSGRPAKDDGSS